MRQTTSPLKPFPNVKGFVAWRYSVRTAVAAAFGRGDDAVRWSCEAEKDGATFELLQHIGSKYESLDQKLAAALASMAHSEISRLIIQASEIATQIDSVLRGRQTLLIVYQYYATNASLGAAYSIVDLLNI